MSCSSKKIKPQRPLGTFLNHMNLKIFADKEFEQNKK